MLWMSPTLRMLGRRLKTGWRPSTAKSRAWGRMAMQTRLGARHPARHPARRGSEAVEFRRTRAHINSERCLR